MWRFDDSRVRAKRRGVAFCCLFMEWWVLGIWVLAVGLWWVGWTVDGRLLRLWLRNSEVDEQSIYKYDLAVDFFKSFSKIRLLNILIFRDLKN